MNKLKLNLEIEMVNKKLELAKEFKIIEIERQKIENKEKLENVKLNKIKK